MKSDLRRISSAYGAWNVTVPGSGEEALPKGTRQLFVGGAGNLVIRACEGDLVSYPLEAGGIVDVQATAIDSTTTCTGIVAHT